MQRNVCQTEMKKRSETEREKWTERFSKLALHEKCFDIRSVAVYLFYIVCVCVCVCVGEREREREREREKEREKERE